MKRPGLLGFFLLAVFGVVFAIEFRTLFAMVGIEISPSTYYPGALVLVGLGLALLYVLTERDARGRPT